MKYFLQSFSPFHCIKKGICHFLEKYCTQVLVNSLEDKACRGKIWLDKLAQHDLNSVVSAIKLQTKYFLIIYVLLAGALS